MRQLKTIRVFINQTVLIVILFSAFSVQAQKSEIENKIINSNVVWNSQSENSLGSMPAGNGDIGINLWVEKNGDLLFYLSKTDTWSENGRLLKVGKVRLSLSPNPFKEGIPFQQKLNIANGLIQIEAGEDGSKVSIEAWVDANNPVVELDVKSEKPISATVSTEPWRNKCRKIESKVELHSAYGLHDNENSDVWVEKDTILNVGKDVIWLHRNKRSIWLDNLKLQGLESYTKKAIDPLMNRTFGGLIRSKMLQKLSGSTLETKDPIKSFSVSVYAFTSIADTMESWITQINQKAKTTELKSRKIRIEDHIGWWNSYWDQSYIYVGTTNQEEQKKAVSVANGYILQRYMNASSGRGNSPIKFNGSIFTVDTENLPGEFNGFDADYRRWGGPYWWQNTRLPYWSMLESGDFELMKPLFNMYSDALPLRKLATEEYYNHKGAFFPETMYFWGTYVDANYGRVRTGLSPGMTENEYIRYYWQNGLEISLMMLDYYSFTKDQSFFSETLLPVVSEILDFYDFHWARDDQGKIHFDPAMSLETYKEAVNPLPEIVGIRKVCSELLKLSDTAIMYSQKEQWRRLIDELPEVPMQKVDGECVLAPAQVYSGKQNTENPELYAIFPYRAYGVGKSDLEMARKTFDRRTSKETGGWQQNAIKAAYLGLTDEAAELTTANFNNSNSSYRFPAMWGPNYDWVPDQDHGTVAMIALQRMLLQYDNDKIQLLGAWPVDWDVEFRLYAPQETIVDCKVKNGEVISLQVTPECRREDIVIAPEFRMSCTIER